MKPYRIISLLILCLIPMVSFTQIKDRISINSSDFKLNKIQEFDQIIWKGDYMTDNEGKPELPVYRLSYVLPVNAIVSGLSFQTKQKQQLREDAYIYPVQADIPTNNTKFVNFTQPDIRTYDSDLPYPDLLYEIESDDFFQGYHIVTFRIYPFEYIPKKRVLNYYSELEYTIEYTETKEVKIIRPMAQSVVRADLCKKFIQSIVRNSNDIDVFGSNTQSLTNGRMLIQAKVSGLRSDNLSILDEIVPDYIIITCDSLKSAFQPFADWKIKKGLFTIIVTTETLNANYTGSNMAEKIRKYLIDAYGRWGDGLFVLLGGDINIVPSAMVAGKFFAGENNHLLKYPTDMYYSAYYSNTWGPLDSIPPTISLQNNLKVILGRIPVSNTQEVYSYINKVILYEKAYNIGSADYVKNNLYSVAYMQGSGSQLYDFCLPSVKLYHTNYVPSHINKKYICDRSSNNGGDIELNRNNFLSLLDNGNPLTIGKFHLIYHMDHGSPMSMGISNKDKGENINRADMDNLTNGTSYQIFMSSSCHPANFQYDCIGKHYLVNPNGGGLAFLGNTDSGTTGEYTQLQYFLQAIYNTTGHLGIGRAFQNIHLQGSHGQKWRLHLLGDPEMQVWTNTPQTLNAQITSPSSKVVTIGSQTVTVSVNGLSADTARICLWKGSEVYETRKVVNGIHSFSVTPETAGTMYVTVTAHNFFPVEDSIIVNTSTAPNLFIQSVNFVDNGTSGSIGNGNGRNDAGETIRLQAVIRNNGVNTATRPTAILTCNNDSIAITNASASLGNLASGSSVTVQFLYQINKDMRERSSNSQNPVTFQLNITNSNGLLWTKSFNIDVFATELQPRNKIIVTPANGNIGTNTAVTFNIELQNTGQAPATGLTAVLTSSNVASCSSTPRTYPTIGQFETKTANTNFQFTTNTNTNPTFNLSVTNAYGKAWNFTFNLTKPAAPTNLQATAGEHDILLTWTAAANATGYNIYRCKTGETDTVKVNNVPVTFTFFNDIGLETLTQYDYKVTAVSGSGMESSKGAYIRTCTSYPTKGMFPIAMDNTLTRMIPSITVEDVNSDGKKEIFTANTTAANVSGQKSWIIGLTDEGEDLFNIDNNVTTHSGFAIFDAATFADIAIGDLNAAGEYQVVALTRDHHSFNNHITCYAVKDNNGDNHPDILWQHATSNCYIKGAILANVDNSADGSMEIILRPDGNAGNQPIQILSANGNLFRANAS